MKYTPYKTKYSERLANIRKKLYKPQIKKSNGRQQSSDDIIKNIVTGDILGTGIIGGLDLNITTLI